MVWAASSPRNSAAKAKGAINLGRYAGGEHPVPVDHDPLVDGDRAEIGQQVKRRPMRSRAAPLEQPGRAAKQGARAYGEDAVRTGCLLADPGEQVFILHQGFLTEAARHVQHIELRRVSPSRIGCQTQTVQVEPARWSCHRGGRSRWGCATALRTV